MRPSLSNFLRYREDIARRCQKRQLDKLIQSAAKALTKLKQYEVSIKVPQVEHLVELLKIPLENNEFEFDGHFYIQILGDSMGAVPSPEVCDLRLFDILENIIKKVRAQKENCTSL